MTRLLFTATLLAGTAGCIIYDEDVRYAEDDEIIGEPEIRDPQRPSQHTDTDDPVFDARPIVTLSPHAAVAGSTLIVSMNATDAFPGSLDDIVDVRFFGSANIEVLAKLPRGPSEFLLTLEIPGDAAEGTQDILIELADGNAELVSDAFLVVTSADDLPADDEEPGSGGTHDTDDCP